ncbi:flagellar hook-basal body complex protein FliE [Caulobacter ginsengisoli]|uniref:Flagellar hook-basal body complex protein FliE n=1 Tax=Caulobacter ginsengisoli TaxID=400775 RepID=A0ABU0IK42_9CAUL|nr:flagellar hook-basal body complex protein FliE [Caulobacter ginsengisoli]MDQ0462381.1 flagellar hook-basal body complex protein FliE [Caulobacter ginsengisoli]
MITPFAAAKAYSALQGQAMGGITDTMGGAAKTGPDFGDLVKSAMTDAVQSSKTAESQIAKQVAGKADLIDVVTSISSAEASLETVMAVRDQVISAYQEIMRMPI